MDLPSFDQLTATDGKPAGSSWGLWGNDDVLGVPGMRIAGGTDEVMKKIVGERVLGLPKEPVGS